MSIVIEVANDNRQSTGAAVRRNSTVSHHYRHVELFLLLTIKLTQTPHDAGSVSIRSAHCHANTDISLEVTFSDLLMFTSLLKLF